MAIHDRINKFPYSNMSYQNVDWMIDTVKKNKEYVDSAVSTANAASAAATTAAGQVAAFEDRIEDVEDAIEELNDDVSDLQTADLQNVKLTGNQSIEDTKTFENIVLSGDLTLHSDASLNAPGISNLGTLNVDDLAVDNSLTLPSSISATGTNIAAKTYEDLAEAQANNYVIGYAQIGTEIYSALAKTAYTNSTQSKSGNNLVVTPSHNCTDLVILLNSTDSSSGSGYTVNATFQGSYQALFPMQRATGKKSYAHLWISHGRLFGEYSSAHASDTGSMNVLKCYNLCGSVQLDSIPALTILNAGDYAANFTFLEASKWQ